MFKIDYIKIKFEESLINHYSANEILSMWNLWVLKYIFKISQIDYILNRNYVVLQRHKKQVDNLIKHLLKNQPIQYFFGFTYFKNLKIIINDNVLIPRPETEDLIDIFFSQTNFFSFKKIIDIGTGSGCIAIAIKKKIESHVYAIDICDEALKIAKQNSVANNVQVEYNKIDILNINNHHLLPKIDCIVSNPPYVLPLEVPNDSIIHSEPKNAIFVPPDNPLIFYEAIIKFANSNLNLGGKIFLEINPILISDLTNLIKKYGYFNIKIHNDFYQKKRFIVVSS
ncbi:MAG: hypothetical protein CMP49_06530 [Flavobacteriales bacterium]|nr:hypothetical protein [Flavobacteriales bacterium]|tara:strand:- start:12476 stop:13324 length:849 start_codon:yes stop_codon:yes gene_type:complete